MKNNISAYRVKTKPRFSKKSGIGNFSGARLLDFSVVGLFFEMVLLLFFLSPKILYRQAEVQLPAAPGPQPGRELLLQIHHFSSVTRETRVSMTWVARLGEAASFSSHAPIKLPGTLFQEHFSSNASVHLPGSRSGSQNLQVQQWLVACSVFFLSSR